MHQLWKLDGGGRTLERVSVSGPDLVHVPPGTRVVVLATDETVVAEGCARVSAVVVELAPKARLETGQAYRVVALTEEVTVAEPAPAGQGAEPAALIADLRCGQLEVRSGCRCQLERGHGGPHECPGARELAHAPHQWSR